MKNIIYTALALSAIFVASCKKDTLQPVQKELIPGDIHEIIDTLSGPVTVNTTLTRTTFLSGLVYVKPGITLTINPGVTIKCSSYGDRYLFDYNLSDVSYMKGTLLIEKGAKLISNGTPAAPIVWTSDKPAVFRRPGDWGGIVILGNAPITSSFGEVSNSYIGLGQFRVQPDARYGGPDSTDNSGSITYNRIEYGGGILLFDMEFGDSEGITSLNLCGVGSNTTIHHVEVANSFSDGFHFLGGTVNTHHLISFNSRDEDFSFDEGFNGKLQFIVGYKFDFREGVDGTSMIEVQNNDRGQQYAGRTKTNPFIVNATLIGGERDFGRPPVKFKSCVYVKDRGLIRLVNSIVIPYGVPSLLTSTPSSYPSFFLPKTATDASVVFRNLFAPASPNIIFKDVDDRDTKEGHDYTLAPDNALKEQFVVNENTFVAWAPNLKLGAKLEPLSGSPALKGGINLAAYGFVGTSQRGAVTSNDVWTNKSWISFERSPF